MKIDRLAVEDSKKLAFALLGLAFLAPALLFAQAAGSGPKRVTAIQNDAVRLVYDLGAGTFDLLERPSNRIIIHAAHSQIGEWSTADSNCTRTAKISKVTDELGAGTQLMVKCSRPGAPVLLTEFNVYGSSNTFVTLRMGLENTAPAPVRVHQFYPLNGGLLFPAGDWTDVRSLNGDSACAQARVTGDRFRRSANNLLLTFKQDGRRRSLVLGGLKTADFTKWAETSPQGNQPPDEGNPGAAAALEASDPVGRLVDAGATYLPADSFYLDGGTADPFDALEQYGRRLALATHAQPHIYDFPTVCAWYAGVWHTRGAQNHPEKSTYRLNTTAGLVEEMDQVRASGFLRYARVAGRLVPDTYEPLNPQGWWDDAHWQRGGYYVAPYETSRKFGRAMHSRSGLAFTYFQPTCGGPPSLMSKDFRALHTDWLCGRDVNRALDFTNPDAQQHLRRVFAAMRGGIDGMMVDYCDDLWLTEAGRGGFLDPHATSTSFYRTFFAFAKNGLGKDSWLHERNLHQPDNDLTLGIVDSQRTSDDTDRISPDMVSRSGLRWYKNRVVLNYDMDSKELNSSWKVKGFSGSDTDGRRMMLTMAAIAASRLLTANSFRDLSPDVLHDLSRAFPYYSERRSARPVDAFAHEGWPRVYDFAVNSHWHQTVFYNNSLPTEAAGFSVPLSGDPVDGALGLDGAKDYYVYDFWNNHFAGRVKGSDTLNQTLRPGEARMLSIHQVEPNPQFLSTSRHLMQGYVDLARRPVWNARNRTLSGAARIIGGETYDIVIALNGFHPLKASAKNARIRLEPVAGDDNLALLRMDAPENATIEWTLACQ
jgi:hypothetical protein